LRKRRVGFGGAATRSVKRRRQISNLRRATDLEALIGRPGIAAGLADQRRDAYVPELHRAASRCSARRDAPERIPVLTDIATPSELV
jgi:hypothetical protein